MLEMAGIKYVENKSELTIKTEQGQVKIVSAFHPERIKGFSFTDFGFDEIDTLDLAKGKPLSAGQESVCVGAKMLNCLWYRHRKAFLPVTMC
jgi:hypothetical protein